MCHMKTALLLGLSLASAGALFAQGNAANGWMEPFAPYKVIGNVY